MPFTLSLFSLVGLSAALQLPIGITTPTLVARAACAVVLKQTEIKKAEEPHPTLARFFNPWGELSSKEETEGITKSEEVRHLALHVTLLDLLQLVFKEERKGCASHIHHIDGIVYTSHRRPRVYGTAVDTHPTFDGIMYMALSSSCA